MRIVENWMVLSDKSFYGAGYTHKEKKHIGRCEHCDEKIMAGEMYYKVEGEIVCEDCIRYEIDLWIEEYGKDVELEIYEIYEHKKKRVTKEQVM